MARQRKVGGELAVGNGGRHAGAARLRNGVRDGRWGLQGAGQLIEHARTRACVAVAAARRSRSVRLDGTQQRREGRVSRKEKSESLTGGPHGKLKSGFKLNTNSVLSSK
jgi:hypothetical protein